MHAEENGHRHRLVKLFRQQFGAHIPLIQWQDMKSFVQRWPNWLEWPPGLNAVRRQVAEIELETKRFYARATERTINAGVPQLLGDFTEEERKHQTLTEELETARRGRGV